MSLYRLYILILLTASSLYCSAQRILWYNKADAQPVYYVSDSTQYSISLTRTNCKGFNIYQGIAVPEKVVAMVPEINRVIDHPIIKKAPKFIIVHGNIGYDYYYRSAIDTPVAQKDFQQHTERVYLDILIKEKYPLKVNFIGRQSNSPYFRNFADVNFQFDRNTYTKNLKQQMLAKLKAQVPAYQYPDLAQIESELKKLKDQYSKTKSWLEDPATLQRIIEDREKAAYQQAKAYKDSINALAADETGSKTDGSIIPLKDSGLSFINSLKAKQDSIQALLSAAKGKVQYKKDSITSTLHNRIDTLTAPYAKLYEKKKQQLDSLEKKINLYKNKADSVKGVVQKDITKIRQKIYNATNEKELRKLAAQNGIKLEKQTGLEKRLASVKTFSIGRSMLDYTELTAKNITVTGVNAEYNPSYYLAIAAGKIDYRFRDFLNRHTRDNNQYLVMGRLGAGNKDHAALIFSYFMGRKNTTQFSLSDSVKNYVNIMGYSLEAIYKKNEFTSISAEFAKSTKPVSGSLQTGKQTGSMWNYSDKSNMGINIQAQTRIPETHTNLSGFFRKTGEHFQSFSLFSYNTDQTSWLARADQAFFKNRVTLTGMLRRNDFTNPFTDKTYKTSTVFKSVLLNIRFPKYPSVSVGYYPGTQLYLVNKERIRESAYYILNGSVVYSYRVKGLSMNSSFVYNRYTNEATDSGFVAYRGVNYYASQTLFLKKLQLQAGYSYSRQTLLQFYTLEGSGEYALGKWLRAGAGVKYNDINGGHNYWGENILLSAGLGKFGTLQFQYEKSYLPTINQTLYPVETGRVSYYKNF